MTLTNTLLLCNFVTLSVVQSGGWLSILSCIPSRSLVWKKGVLQARAPAKRRLFCAHQLNLMNYTRGWVSIRFTFTPCSLFFATKKKKDKLTLLAPVHKKCRLKHYNPLISSIIWTRPIWNYLRSAPADPLAPFRIGHYWWCTKLGVNELIF